MSAWASSSPSHEGMRFSMAFTPETSGPNAHACPTIRSPSYIDPQNLER